MRNSAFDPAVRVALATGREALWPVVSCFGKTQNLIFQFKIWAYFSRKKSPCQGKEFFVEKMPLLSRVQGDVGEVVCHEIHLVHGPHPAVEAGPDSRHRW